MLDIILSLTSAFPSNHPIPQLLLLLLQKPHYLDHLLLLLLGFYCIQIPYTPPPVLSCHPFPVWFIVHQWS
jgi:hypothetical protein